MNATKLREFVSPKVRQSEMVVASELSPREVEDLLDWIENQGCTILKVDQGVEGFTVHFRCPPGLQLIPTLHSGRPGQPRITKIDVEWNDRQTLPGCGPDRSERGPGLIPALIPA